MPAAFSMRVFMPQGEPQGLRIVEKTNWTGVGIIFPRNRLNKALERTELSRTGVYVLWGDDDPISPEVYVGQSENLSRRVRQHFANEAMDWWTNAVAFTTKDDGFNQAHARYLEWALTRRALDSNRCELKIKLVPSMPSVSEADQADAEHFFEDLLQCLPLAGLDAFERSPAKDQSSTGNGEPLELHLKLPKVGVRAIAIPGVKSFTVLKGAQVRRDEELPDAYPKEHASYRSLRQQLIEEGKIADVGKDYLELTDDQTFRSPSEANVVIAGGPMAPYDVWKSANGRTYREILDSRAGDDE